MFKINQGLSIERAHNVPSTNIFTSQNLNIQVEHKTQHLSKHISLASLTYLIAESHIKDSKL